MLVGEIMTSPAVTVRDDASPQVAMSLLARRRLTLLPVVNAQGRLVGVVSEADLLSLPEPPDPRAHLRRVPPVTAKPAPRAVAELMTSTPQTTLILRLIRLNVTAGWRLSPSVLSALLSHCAPW